METGQTCVGSHIENIVKSRTHPVLIHEWLDLSTRSKFVLRLCQNDACTASCTWAC